MRVFAVVMKHVSTTYGSSFLISFCDSCSSVTYRTSISITWFNSKYVCLFYISISSELSNNKPTIWSRGNRKS